MMFDECSFRRNNVERNLTFKCRLTMTYRRLSLGILVLIFMILFWLNGTSISRNKENFQFPSSKTSSSMPTLARIVYLFLCENQAEVDLYMPMFPSVTADAVFYCWREKCHLSRFRPPMDVYINTWSSASKRNATLVSLQPISSFHHIQSQIFIINEKQLNIQGKLTWTTARNKLYELALNAERKQQWRWAYYVFADGDVHTACPLAEQLLTNKTIVDYGNSEECLFASHFYAFTNLTNTLIAEDKCFLLFDAFLLSISPAVATISGASGPMAYPGLLTQVVYHIDAIFNAIHRDALPFVLPYCPRYDGRSWWTSQAIFVYRSLCLYGHVISFDGVHIGRQNHRLYPRVGNPWLIDNDMNLVPEHLIRLQTYMKQSRFVSPLVLHHYPGWSLQLTSEMCRRNHTAMTVETCLVHSNDKNSR